MISDLARAASSGLYMPSASNHFVRSDDDIRDEADVWITFFQVGTRGCLVVVNSAADEDAALLTDDFAIDDAAAAAEEAAEDRMFLTDADLLNFPEDDSTPAPKAA